MGSRDFNPLDIFLQLESDIRRSAEEVMRAVGFQPSADMYDTRTAIVIKIELAGVRPEKLNITMSEDDRALTVAGERTELRDERSERIGCYQLEIYYGPFERQIVLPPNARIERDSIVASYRDGILLITIPKRVPANSEVRTIEVTGE